MSRSLSNANKTGRARRSTSSTGRILPIVCLLIPHLKALLIQMNGQLTPAKASGPTNVLGTGPVNVRWS